MMEHPTSGIALGQGGKPLFRLAQRTLSGPVDIASPARSTQHEGLAAGGRTTDRRGFAPRYHATYYGAFVLDPDGNNIEVVCHRAR